MYAKASKCSFLKERHLFLGHIVSNDGVHTDPSKIEALRNMTTPRDITALRSFLGLAGYYRRFVRGYAQIAEPLIRLTSPKVPFAWDLACQAAFETLREALMSAPILGIS